MKEEVWKPVKGYEEKYHISNYGKVKSLPKKHCTVIKILKPSLSRGYFSVSLSKDNKIYRKLIHRLIAEAFIPNPNDLPQINHINGDKSDNRIENLEWCTAQENTIHAFNTGLCNIRKLQKEDIINIHQLNKTMTHREIARLYSVSHKVIWSVLNNKTYLHIDS